MRPLIKWIMMAVLAWVAVGDVQAQTMTQAERRARVDSVLAARYYRTPYDTNYVVRPEGKLTLKVRINQTGNTFHAKGTVNGIYSKADLSTSHKTTFALVGIYRGIGVGIAVNPAKWKGIYPAGCGRICSSSCNRGAHRFLSPGP